MDLKIYDVIKNIFVTAKSSDLLDKFGKVTFEVHRLANKIMVRQAVEKIWNVKVENVRILNVKGKGKTFGRRPFKTSARKKAIITLKDGYKIKLPGQFESMGAASSAAESKTETAKGK